MLAHFSKKCAGTVPVLFGTDAEVVPVQGNTYTTQYRYYLAHVLPNTGTRQYLHGAIKIFYIIFNFFEYYSIILKVHYNLF